MRSVMLVVALVACGGSPEPAPSPSSTPTAPTALDARSDVSLDDFAALHEQGVTVIDVRTAAEYAAGHVPGAVLVPVDEISPTHPKLVDLPRDEPVYFICKSGARSARAADIMASGGFRAVSVDGGTDAWVASGRPVE